jgi:hypothetical protein
MRCYSKGHSRIEVTKSKLLKGARPALNIM